MKTKTESNDLGREPSHPKRGEEGAALLLASSAAPPSVSEARQSQERRSFQKEQGDRRKSFFFGKVRVHGESHVSLPLLLVFVVFFRAVWNGIKLKERKGEII